MKRTSKKDIEGQSTTRRSPRKGDEQANINTPRERKYPPYRNEHDEYRGDWNRNTYYGDDWYSTENRIEPPYPERNEEWYRRTYGLPAGNRRMGQRHDIAQWGNPSFTQNTTNRQYDRIQDNQQRNDFRREDQSNYPDHDNRSGTDGGHRGKGPRGYSRTDERVKEDINERLTDDAYIDASEIDVAVERGEVTLSGTVSDRSAKRRAEDITELVSGVTNVENRIRVKTSLKENRKTTDHVSERKRTADHLN